MNIFLLDKDFRKNAEFLCDTHLRKMIVESYQLLNNGLPEHKRFYKTSHLNHPCSVWVRKDINNYRTLAKITAEYIKEYEFRFNKKHKCSFIKLPFLKQNFTVKYDLPQCLPDEFKQNDTVLAYRAYYVNKLKEWRIRQDKRQIIANWTKRNMPVFIE